MDFIVTILVVGAAFALICAKVARVYRSAKSPRGMTCSSSASCDGCALGDAPGRRGRPDDVPGAPPCGFDV